MRLCTLPLLALAACGLAAGTNVHTQSAPFKVVCYYGSWAVYRPGDGRFDVEDIDPLLCTHAIYTFAGLDAATHTIKSLDPWNDLYDNYGKGAYLRFTALKERNPQLKTLLAIGGWNEGSEKYSEMTASPEHRKIFVASCVEFLRKYGFDGLDLDWEYPAQRGGKATDRDNFGHLVRELSDALVPQDLLLTAAVGQSRATIDGAYNMLQLAEYLDIINVMAYDYHGTWDPFTGHVAPLYGSSQDIKHGGGYEDLNVNFTIHYYMQGGVPASKLAMGLPTYGRGFLLDDPTRHGLYAPARQPMPACPYTRDAGFCGFAEICQMLGEGGWTSVTDAEQQSLYMYKGDVWVGYDDLVSIKRKVDLIRSLGLGGGMVWSLETDDLHNRCGLGTALPFLNAVWTELNGDIPTPSPAPPEPTTSPGPTPGPTPSPTPGPTPSPPGPTPTRVCQKEGLNPDPQNKCSAIFYECEHVGANWRVTEMECAPGLVFDSQHDACSWPQQTPECQ
ncbi:chitotriosidase-1-like [Pollicipes pollicipes]|uniref:chitotriosidase-1-like n=1 Tax=Pollicipes pollicipes TaxID=41117 RepID=UPI0018856EF2|nr:chitotriosidase-1-like [Pollicipes pollicipes]